MAKPKFLALSLASSDAGDSDIVSFTTEDSLAEFIKWQARGGAYKIIVFQLMKGDKPDLGQAVWSPEDEIAGDRLKSFAAEGSPRWRIGR